MSGRGKAVHCKDIYGDALKEGDWALFATPNSTYAQIRWIKVVEITNKGKLKYAEIAINVARDGEISATVDTHKQWASQPDFASGRTDDVESNWVTFVNLRVLKRDGAAVMIMPEEKVPAVVIDAWDDVQDIMPPGITTI